LRDQKPVLLDFVFTGWGQKFEAGLDNQITPLLAQKLLKSITLQSDQDFEWIVVDGNSTDGTADLFEGYSDRITHLISEPDDGIYDAMNKGIELATGEITGNLNADDWYAHSGVLSQVANTFSADESIDAVYGDIVYVTRKQPHNIVRYWESCSYHDGLFEKGWMPAHPSFFVKREMYSRYGKFDLDLKIQSDFELTMRLIAINRIKTRYLPGVMVKMRMGGVTNNRISNVIKGNLEAYTACRKNGLAVTPLFMVRKILSRLPQFFRKPRH
ncbi:MAG: glycosyltransferase, partial [Gammaproteobacteria bacterium]|nr:glycosyltransferase [Gammaproteobacteria bacterium]MDX2487068.1 glycosyltransferase [Gammaproteobacteria bacterium]